MGWGGGGGVGVQQRNQREEQKENKDPSLTSGGQTGWTRMLTRLLAPQATVGILG